jgi:hypothetical protein
MFWATIIQRVLIIYPDEHIDLVIAKIRTISHQYMNSINWKETVRTGVTHSNNIFSKMKSIRDD